MKSASELSTISTGTLTKPIRYIVRSPRKTDYKYIIRLQWFQRPELARINLYGHGLRKDCGSGRTELHLSWPPILESSVLAVENRLVDIHHLFHTLGPGEFVGLNQAILSSGLPSCIVVFPLFEKRDYSLGPFFNVAHFAVLRRITAYLS
jgi:hypothetical protein